MDKIQKEDTDQSKLFEYVNGEQSSIRRTNKLKDKLVPCPFCEIIRNQNKPEPPRRILFHDDNTAAFLDRRPVYLGHTLVVPIKHYETLLDLPVEVVPPLFSNAQLVARAVRTAMNADGIFLAINNNVSQSVPHLHIHIVPRKFGDGLKGFFWPRRSYKNDEEMNRISESIRQAIEAELEY